MRWHHVTHQTQQTTGTAIYIYENAKLTLCYMRDAGDFSSPRALPLRIQTPRRRRSIMQPAQFNYAGACGRKREKRLGKLTERQTLLFFKIIWCKICYFDQNFCKIGISESQMFKEGKLLTTTY